MIFLKSIAFVSLALPFASAQSNVCAKAGKQCDQYSPCCNSLGYCANEAYACLSSEGCNAPASFGTNTCVGKAMCKSFKEDFNDPSVLVSKYKFSGDVDKERFWIETPELDNAEIKDGNLVLTLKYNDNEGRGHGATIASTRWLVYGSISARFKTSDGVGVVNSFITKTSVSDKEGDEIDFEFVGSKPGEVQTNFYTNGEIDYTKGEKKSLSGFRASDDFHVYTVNWTPDTTTWSVDGNVIRTLQKATSDKYPTSNQRVWFSIWDGGCKQPQGTIEWAGGKTAWCDDASKRSQTYQLLVDWVEIKCATEDTSPVQIPNLWKNSTRKNDGKAISSNGGSKSSGGDTNVALGEAGNIVAGWLGMVTAFLGAAWLMV